MGSRQVLQNLQLKAIESLKIINEEYIRGR